MPSLVIRLVSPPSKCSGYLRRFMLEVAPHCYIGGVSAKVADDLVSLITRLHVRGRIGVLAQTAPFGVRWLYSMGVGDSEELDGVWLPKRGLKSRETGDFIGKSMS